MLSQEKITRINELSRKSKQEGLTKSEAREQQKLRSEYIQSFRNSFSNSLHSVKVVDPEGKDVTPKKLKESKKKQNNNTHLN